MTKSKGKGRGRRSALPPDKLEYLESHLPEFLALQPHLGEFWAKVERGYFGRWKVEDELGLPALDVEGVSIEDAGVSEEHQLAVGQAQEKARKAIRNWYNNRSQKEKRLLNDTSQSAASNVAIKDFLASLGTKQGRKAQRIEIWQQRNPEIMKAALAESGYSSAIGVAPDNETKDERKARMSAGKRDQMIIFRRVRDKEFAKASAEEKAEVEKLYMNQESSASKETAETTQGSQKSCKRKILPSRTGMVLLIQVSRGINKVGGILKEMHGALERITGWVGSTVLTGPTPNLDGKISTYSYCHGVTPAGQTLDQVVTGWEDNVLKPLQQFGKTVFDHKTRRARALGSVESEGEMPEDASVIRNGRKRPSKKTTDSTSVAPVTPAPVLPIAFAATPPEASTSQAAGGAPATSPTFPADALVLDNETLSKLYPMDPWSTTDYFDNVQWPATFAIPEEEDLASLSLPAAPSPPFVGVRPLTADSPSHEALHMFSSNFTFGSDTAEPSGSPPPSVPDVPPRASGVTWMTSSPAHPSSPTFTLRTAVSSPALPAIPSLSAPPATPVTPVIPAQTPPPARPAPRPAFRGGSGAMVSPFGASPQPLQPTTPSHSDQRRLALELATRQGPSTVTTPSPLRLSVTAAQDVEGSTVVSGTAAMITLDVPMTTVLTADDFPESRPMSNAPRSKNPPAMTRGVGHGRGSGGRGRGGRGGRGGCGGRGGVVGGGVDAAEMGDGDGMEDVNDGSVLVPLAGQTLPEPISRERVREIRMFEKKRDAAAARVSQQRDHGVFVLPPPPPGHEALPAGPGALGRRRLPPVEPAVLGAQPVNTVASGAQPVNPVALGAQSVNPVAPGAQPVQSAALGARSRRHVANYEPPKKRTMEDIRKDAAAKREAKETEKRKRGLENTEPPVSKKRKTK